MKGEQVDLPSCLGMVLSHGNLRRMCHEEYVWNGTAQDAQS